MVSTLADEALRMRLFPGIAFRGTDWDRRAWVIGTALDVWQIIDAYQDIGSLERMVDGGSASKRNISLALAYYSDSRRRSTRPSRKTAGRSSNFETRFPSVA